MLSGQETLGDCRFAVVIVIVGGDVTIVTPRLAKCTFSPRAARAAARRACDLSLVSLAAVDAV